MSSGVRAGASSAEANEAPKPWKPDSATVGTSGATSERLRLDTPSARSLPDFTCGYTPVVTAKIESTWPATTSTIDWPVPLYGMCLMSTPEAARKYAYERWLGEPLPPEA